VGIFADIGIAHGTLSWRVIKRKEAWRACAFGVALRDATNTNAVFWKAENKESTWVVFQADGSCRNSCFVDILAWQSTGAEFCGTFELDDPLFFELDMERGELWLTRSSGQRRQLFSGLLGKQLFPYFSLNCGDVLEIC